MSLIVTSAAGLRATYGEGGAMLVETKLAQVVSTLPSARLQTLASPSVATALHAELKSSISQQRVTQEQLTSGILIVGDQRVFPSFVVPNPVSDRILDPDTTVLTDNPYGQFDWQQPEQCILPPFPVGRLAAGASDPPTSLCSLLDSLIALRRQAGLRTGYVEITSRQWQDASRSVMSTLAPSARVIVSPDGRVTAANPAALDCRFLYCNLHGFPNDSAWSGYDNGLSRPVPALTPDAIQTQFVSGTVVFTEACYGLATSGKKTAASNALSFLSAGAAAVIGSTGLAFGTADVKPQDLIDADVLARSFFNSALRSGSSIGQCLLQARKSLRATAPISDVYLIKTLLEFQLLGDPGYVASA
jgi:hypothetical protein